MTGNRLQALRESISRSGLDAIVLTSLPNIHYSSGFTGSSAFAVVTVDTAALVTDGRYREQAGGEVPEGWEVVIYTVDVAGELARLLTGAGKAGIESTSSLGFRSNLDSVLGGGTTLETATDMVEILRSTKDAGEVASIKAAIECAKAGFIETIPLAAPGVTERELAAELDYRMALAGSDGRAFDTVVASGPNSSLPHAGITDRALEEGDLLVVDFGAVRDGYHSDNTRTLVVGEPGRRQAEIIDAVRGAVRAACASLEPGVKAADVDSAARGYLEEAGMAECFVHSVGHGVGLEVHEKPSLSARSGETIEPGMVFTIEPGVYVEGWGGVRFEEMVLMTGTGPEVLSASIPM